MARRLLCAFTVASTLLAAEALPSARACDHTGWVYDPVDVPACVEVSYVAAGQFEFANGCSEALTLAAPDCDDCTVPGVIPPGGSGALVLDPEPTRERDGVVDLEWEVGGTSGTLTFTYPVNACRNYGDTCAASPVTSRGWALISLLAFALALLARRRPARLEGRS